MDLEFLTQRSRLFTGTREFFDLRGYLEVDTPVLAPDLIPETCLEVFETTYLRPPDSRSQRREQKYWLVPSPELWMKKLIADHGKSIYQISKCFRNGESVGRIHSPEFTMLEFYTMDADYRDSIEITEDLWRTLMTSDTAKDLRPPFVKISMEEAFQKWAGFSLYDAAEEGPPRLAAEARRLGLDPPQWLSLADLYNLIFVHAVETALPRDKPVVLMDYPAFVPCLAKTLPGGRAKERWELYGRGVELANCYSEETDAEEVRRYFTREGEEKNQGALVPHRIDGDYWRTFLPRRRLDSEKPTSFPRCSGVALGMDRLLMVLSGRSTIDSVLPFPMA
jgi:lysyl-tRNA synthetase class 2